MAEAVAPLSRNQAARLIADGMVTVDGQPRGVATRPAAGARVEVTLPEPQSGQVVAEDIPLALVYRDEAMLVIDKAAGMVVHPAPGHAGGTLANALLALDPDLTVGYAQRPGLVHRLDRDTSGLLVVARDDEALRSLQAQWAARTVEKLYLALVRGVPRLARATVDAPIGRDPRDRRKMAVVAEGRSATTEYRVVEPLSGMALLECRIHTGRTHQIRVHLASIGHPIIGDGVYGTPEAGLGRQFLHAFRLRFRHPRTGEPVAFESPLPAELKRYLEVRRTR